MGDYQRRVRPRGGCGCQNVIFECNTQPAAAPAGCGQQQAADKAAALGIQCESHTTYETVVEPTIYYTLEDVENLHIVKHIVPVVYQQTIKNVTQHEYVVEQTVDQAQEQQEVGFEQNVAGLASNPCPEVTAATCGKKIAGSKCAAPAPLPAPAPAPAQGPALEQFCSPSNLQGHATVYAQPRPQYAPQPCPRPQMPMPAPRPQMPCQQPRPQAPSCRY